MVYRQCWMAGNTARGVGASTRGAGRGPATPATCIRTGRSGPGRNNRRSALPLPASLCRCRGRGVQSCAISVEQAPGLVRASTFRPPPSSARRPVKKKMLLYLYCLEGEAFSQHDMKIGWVTARDALSWLSQTKEVTGVAVPRSTARAGWIAIHQAVMKLQKSARLTMLAMSSGTLCVSCEEIPQFFHLSADIVPANYAEVVIVPSCKVSDFRHRQVHGCGSRETQSCWRHHANSR